MLIQGHAIMAPATFIATLPIEARLGTIFLLLFSLYTVYLRFVHPLSRYPGPVLASLTPAWKAYWVYKGTLHERLVDLHMRLGPVIRIGPNHLHFWDGEAIAPIYKAGRAMGKTEFYHAFTAFNPNLFGGIDEDIHALRRRQLAHGFSQASIEKLQPLIDEQIKILVGKLQQYAATGAVFDLKGTISFFVLDILGEVAFSHRFNAQIKNEAEHLAAIDDHLLLACVIGELPFQEMTKALTRWSPLPWMRQLVQSRNKIKAICAERVKYKIEHSAGRFDLLKSLVEAQDPETGAKLSEQEINSEAFAMIVAGSHSTSGTLSLLLWHLLHNPEILKKVRDEILQNVGPLSNGQIAYPVQGLEASLPYTTACIRENFRMNPVFTMPLWRRVHSAAGTQIGKFHVPQGTNVCISNYVLHHNPDIWGPDHTVFNPDRWLNRDKDSKVRFLIPFSIGHRMCIGRNLAMTDILKTITTLAVKFDFEPEHTNKRVRLLSSGIGEMEGSFMCKVSLRN
ncbi:putative cytochrome P450 [Xylogone sp. PMI_703]|nr:putative cytochrome P450 [Xylogone sp. PMI_703]